MIFGAYFTGHKLKIPPAATPKVGGKKFDGPKPIKSIVNDPRPPPSSDFDARHKFPLSTTHKIRGNKNHGRKTPQIYIE